MSIHVSFSQNIIFPKVEVCRSIAFRKGKAMKFTSNPKFRLGRIVITPGAISALSNSQENPKVFLKRHQSGDWGDLCDEDKKTNDEAISHEGNSDKQQRVMSAYKTSKGEKCWIITEHDRSVTTLLLPDEY